MFNSIKTTAKKISIAVSIALFSAVLAVPIASTSASAGTQWNNNGAGGFGGYDSWGNGFGDGWNGGTKPKKQEAAAGSLTETGGDVNLAANSKKNEGTVKLKAYSKNDSYGFANFEGKGNQAFAGSSAHSRGGTLGGGMVGSFKSKGSN